MSQHFFRSNIFLKHRSGGNLTYMEEFPGKSYGPMDILKIMHDYVKRTTPKYRIVRITIEEVGKRAG